MRLLGVAALVPEVNAVRMLSAAWSLQLGVLVTALCHYGVMSALQTVRLLGVAALAPEVNAAKNLARLQPGSDAFHDALATLQQINGCDFLSAAKRTS